MNREKSGSQCHPETQSTGKEIQYFNTPRPGIIPNQIELTVQASARLAVTVNLCAMPGGSFFGTFMLGLIKCRHIETVSTSNSGVKLDKLKISGSILLENQKEKGQSEMGDESGFLQETTRHENSLPTIRFGASYVL